MTEAIGQSEFDAIMSPAAEGVEAAVRCFVAGDIEGMVRRLEDVEAGVRLLREWAAG